VIQTEEPIKVLSIGFVHWRPRGLGWDRFYAGPGDYAVERARELRPDLILLGSLTPDVARGRSVPGYEIVRRLKDDPATSRAVVVMLTSLQEPEHRRKAEQAGVDAYVVWPVDQDMLQSRVRVLVQQRRTG
jgi:CheY-like chemotaxis protein